MTHVPFHILNADDFYNYVKKREFALQIRREGDHIPSTKEEIDLALSEAKEFLSVQFLCFEEFLGEYYNSQGIKVFINTIREPEVPKSIPLVSALVNWNGFQNLVSLKICVLINPVIMKCLAEALPRARSLTVLDLSGNKKIGPEGAKYLAGALPKTNIKKLNLESTGIGPEGTTSIAFAIEESKVQWLELYDNKIGLEGAQSLCNVITSERCPLRTLLLRFVCRTFDESDAILYGLTFDTCRLRKLSLWKCCCSEQGEEYIQHILQNNFHLDYLSLGRQSYDIELESNKWVRRNF